MNELPRIANCAYSASTFAGNEWDQLTTTGSLGCSTQSITRPPDFYNAPNNFVWTSIDQTPQQESKMQTRRIVQVFIADPNENVPLEKALLYQDEKPHLTDLTDQELFFELDIKEILLKHNEFRVTVVDKEASEGKNKDVLLESAKIRDLKMTVVSVATF